MSDELTNSQIALLCAIEEHDDSEATSEQKRDLARLVSGGYAQPTGDHPGSAYDAHRQGYRVSRRARRRAERGVEPAQEICEASHPFPTRTVTQNAS